MTAHQTVASCATPATTVATATQTVALSGACAANVTSGISTAILTMLRITGAKAAAK